MLVFELAFRRVRSVGVQKRRRLPINTGITGVGTLLREPVKTASDSLAPAAKSATKLQCRASDNHETLRFCFVSIQPHSLHRLESPPLQARSLLQILLTSIESAEVISKAFIIIIPYLKHSYRYYYLLLQGQVLVLHQINHQSTAQRFCGIRSNSNRNSRFTSFLPYACKQVLLQANSPRSWVFPTQKSVSSNGSQPHKAKYPRSREIAKLNLRLVTLMHELIYYLGMR